MNDSLKIASLKALFPENLSDRGGLFVACSGGVDSMVLLDLLRNGAEMGYWPKPKVLHVNYGLRGSASDEDQKLVEEYATKYQLSCEVLAARHICPKEPTEAGIQEWARNVRRGWFREKLGQFDLIACAHHQNDLAENILMRLCRGSGFRLAGMHIFDAPYWRPLLPWSKASIQEYAHRQKVPYRDDESNVKLIYSRNRVRINVIPNLEAIYPETVSKLVNFAEDLDDITDFLDHSFTEQLAGSELKGQFLRSLPRGIAFHVIATFIKRQAGPIQISRSMLERIWRHLKGEHGQIKDWSEDLIGSNRIRIKGDRLRVESQKRSFNQRVAQHRKNILRHVTSMWLERGALAQVDLSELRKNSYDGDPTEKT